MKTLKIIIGLLLLFGAGKEYVAASRELGSLFSPGILVGMLFIQLISTWLIGSGFSSGKFILISFAFLKFFVFS